MLDLVQLAVDADHLATEARHARCCDALWPCRPCMTLRRNVLARRHVILFPRRTRRPLTRLPLVSMCLEERLAS